MYGEVNAMVGAAAKRPRHLESPSPRLAVAPQRGRDAPRTAVRNDQAWPELP